MSEGERDPYGTETKRLNVEPNPVKPYASSALVVRRVEDRETFPNGASRVLPNLWARSRPDPYERPRFSDEE